MCPESIPLAANTRSNEKDARIGRQPLLPMLTGHDRTWARQHAGLLQTELLESLLSAPPPTARLPDRLINQRRASQRPSFPGSKFVETRTDSDPGGPVEWMCVRRKDSPTAGATSGLCRST